MAHRDADRRQSRLRATLRFNAGDFAPVVLTGIDDVTEGKGATEGLSVAILGPVHCGQTSVIEVETDTRSLRADVLAVEAVLDAWAIDWDVAGVSCYGSSVEPLAGHRGTRVQIYQDGAPLENCPTHWKAASVSWLGASDADGFEMLVSGVPLGLLESTDPFLELPLRGRYPVSVRFNSPRFGEVVLESVAGGLELVALDQPFVAFGRNVLELIELLDPVPVLATLHDIPDGSSNVRDALAERYVAGVATS